jgi:predicted small secreted protein
MKTTMKFLAVALLATVALTGCANTWSGAGRDVENMGEEMQKSAGYNH